MQDVMIDMVKVTRCYKCEHWKNFSKRNETDDTDQKDIGYCKKFGTMIGAADFCSRADEGEET